MNVAVIGSGVSGLSISRLLKDIGFEVTVFEKHVYPGGIARSRNVNGVAYHIVGGHCFNSKHQDVLDFVFNRVLPKEDWHKVERKSRINFKNHLVSYPIEFAIKEIAVFDLDLAIKMVRDYFDTSVEDRSNLANWFKSKFGITLAEEYFIPYNEKIWNQKAEMILPDWVEDKLPLPDKNGFTKALFLNNKDNMPHSSFYYPNQNSQNAFIDALAKDLNIFFNKSVNSILYKQNKWVLNKEYEFDLVISTIPLNVLPDIISSVPNHVQNAAKKLMYNKVSTMLWKTSGNQDTWTYHPSKDSLFHRHIHIGNFFIPNKNYTITEAVGEHTFHKMFTEGEKFDYLEEPVDHHISDHAYVVFDRNYIKAKATIMDYIDGCPNLFTLGRFGEWEYYNMDICIKSALRLAKKIMVQNKLP
jgi:protoporphyrinogen oxidase